MIASGALDLTFAWGIVAAGKRTSNSLHSCAAPTSCDTTSTTGSQISPLVQRHRTDATLASLQGRCNGDGQQAMDSGDRVRNVALRPDRGRRGVYNHWEGQIFRLQRRDELPRGESSP